jgi:hypothetical protein
MTNDRCHKNAEIRMLKNSQQWLIRSLRFREYLYALDFLLASAR